VVEGADGRLRSPAHEADGCVCVCARACVCMIVSGSVFAPSRMLALSLSLSLLPPSLPSPLTDLSSTHLSGKARACEAGTRCLCLCLCLSLSLSLSLSFSLSLSLSLSVPVGHGVELRPRWQTARRARAHVCVRWETASSACAVGNSEHSSLETASMSRHRAAAQPAGGVGPARHYYV
jgi:hypothetical protein